MTDGMFAARQYSSNRVRPVDWFVLLVCMVVIPSAVLQGIIGFDERSTFAFFVPPLLFAAIASGRLTFHKDDYSLLVLIGVVGAAASLISLSFSQMLMSVTLASAFIAGRILFDTLQNPQILRAVSWFALLLLGGGLVGLLYKAAGGGSLMDVQIGYRQTHLYLTTYSLASIGDTIRPSGIFDEPGAFAMFVAIVTMFNDTLRQNRQLNRVLVILLVSTGALASLVLAVWYVVASNDLKPQRRKGIVLVLTLASVFIALSFVAPANPLTSALDSFYRERLQIVDGRLVGDNRSNQVEDFFRIVDGEMLRKGARNSTELYDTADMAANPFSIVYEYGLVISIPYFLLLIWLGAKKGFKNSYSSLGLLFLLLQRPYLYHMSWSILIAATVLLIHHSSMHLSDFKRPPSYAKA